MSHLAFFTHANVFHHGGQPDPNELSIANIPEDGKDPDVICLMVEYSNLHMTPKDSLSNRGKFCHLAQGNRGLIVIKGLDQRKIFEKLGLFTINLEMLPYFRDLNDRTPPDHLHDEVHEDYDIFECTMVKSYQFARYMQHFNKLQGECKKQMAHLVECGVHFLSALKNLVLKNFVSFIHCYAFAYFASYFDRDPKDNVGVEKRAKTDKIHTKRAMGTSIFDRDPKYNFGE
ncbi:hypothetical protein TNCV_875491 [Trichonephila clavipes]|nr:hypothetical protein TNCV_875491 [Trichonephila clavipes]